MRSVIILILAVFLLAPAGAFAKDYETEHQFKPGDIISAEMFNEIFETIALTKQGLTTAGVVGSYDCTHYMSKGYYESDGTYASYPGWLIQNLDMDADDMLGTRTDMLTIYDDGDGTYSYQTSNYNSFTMYASGEPNSPGPRNPLTVTGNIAVLQVNKDGGLTPVMYLVQRNSPTQITFTYTGSTNDYIHYVTCDKVPPPEKPKQLKASSSGLLVTLTWVDDSENETGFIILRKDDAEGPWETVGNTAVNATMYSDLVEEAGKYWYRIMATNGSGDSVPSNVAKATVTY